MTKDEIAVLGHAFFDGKTLQMFESGGWKDWTASYCPNMCICEWRIKPDEPKTITICTFRNASGNLFQILKDSDAYKNAKYWTHIKSLDQVVEVV